MAKKMITSPVGVAVYPHLDKPDTFKGQTKYKVSLLVSKEDMETFRAKLNELIADEKFDTKKPKLPISEAKEEGFYKINTSSQYKPMIFDSHKRALPEGVIVGGGSEIRFAAELYNYGDGVSLRLKQVQVVKLRERGSGDCSFDEIEDGYTADEEVEADVSAFDL